MPALKRENTLTLDFKSVRKKIAPLDIHRWIRDTFKFTTDQICAIQLDSNRNKIYIKLISDLLVKATLRKWENDEPKIKDEEGNEYVIPISEDGQETMVKIYDIPIDIEDSLIKTELSKYGQVRGIRREKWGGHDDFFPVESGVRTALINLQKNIPSYISVAGWTSLIVYRNQIRTCMLCQDPGHEKRECPRRPAQRIREIRRPAAPYVGNESIQKTYSEVAAGNRDNDVFLEETQNVLENNNVNETEVDSEDASKGVKESDQNKIIEIFEENELDIIEETQGENIEKTGNWQKGMKRGRRMDGSSTSSEEEKKVPKLKIINKRQIVEDRRDEELETENSDAQSSN